MSPSRRGDSGGARTAEERERDRLDRERRRARQRGASSPAGDDGPAPADPISYEVPPAPSYDDVWVESPAAEPTAAQAVPAAPLLGAPPPRYPDFQDPAEAEDPPTGARTGVPAVLARAWTSLSGASAAFSGASAAALARLQKLRVGQPQPRAGADPAGSDADSLRDPVRSRTARRTPARPGVRQRPTSVSKTKPNSSGPGAPRSRRGRIAAVLALAAVVFALWFLFSLFQPLKGGGHGSVAIDIPRGSSSGAIGTLLADRGVITSGFFFKLRATLAGKRGQLESGHFSLRRDMSYGAVLDDLTAHQGRPAQIAVTIPEGLARTEIAKVAKRRGITGDYVRASVHSHVLKPGAYGAPSTVHSLEGFLFPATYDLLPGDPASKLVNAQLTAFRSRIAKVDLSRAKRMRLSAYDVLTIASMVEKEAGVSSDRPLIAAVIYNRLHSGVALGIDSTIRFAINNDYSRPLTASDLRIASPYNTRLHKGLPPTPIGNPGLASIEAAAHPASVPYMYYVGKPGSCGQAFSTTFAQFQQDSARYNSVRAAKGGKSPTTCGR